MVKTLLAAISFTLFSHTASAGEVPRYYRVGEFVERSFDIPICRSIDDAVTAIDKAYSEAEAYFDFMYYNDNCFVYDGSFWVLEVMTRIRHKGEVWTIFSIIDAVNNRYYAFSKTVWVEIGQPI